MKKKYLNVRKDLYKEAYETELSELGINLYSFRYNPYTKLKFHYSIEVASFFVYLLLKTNVKPNSISLFYSFIGLLGVILFWFGSTEAILLALFIFFSKSIPDWMDGHIARIKNQTSLLGGYLDDWGGLVTNTCFQISVSIYLVRATGEFYYYLIILVITTLVAIDLRNYIYQNYDHKQKLLSERFSDKKSSGDINSKLLIILGKVFSILQYDGRSRYTDLVIFIILIEMFYSQMIVSFIFVWIWMFLSIIKFLYSIKVSFDDIGKNIS